MSVRNAVSEEGILDRVITRLQDKQQLDAETVARAKSVMKAQEAKKLGLDEIIDESGTSEARKGRVVSRMVSGKEEVIEDDKRWPYAGFAPMTRVRTSFGDVYAVALRKGDLVKTRSGEFKPIVWLDRIMLDDKFLENMVDSNPITIPEGAIGRGLPKRELCVSARQIVAEQSDFRAQKEAGELLGRPNIRRKYETGLSYTVFHLGQTEDVMCEGLYLRIEV